MKNTNTDIRFYFILFSWLVPIGFMVYGFFLSPLIYLKIAFVIIGIILSIAVAYGVKEISKFPDDE